MATLSDDRLPEWFAAEAYRQPDAFNWNFRCGVRCRDGDLKVLDVPIHVVRSPGRSERIELTKREVLEMLHKHVVTELAKVSLEE